MACSGIWCAKFTCKAMTFHFRHFTIPFFHIFIWSSRQLATRVIFNFRWFSLFFLDQCDVRNFSGRFSISGALNRIIWNRNKFTWNLITSYGARCGSASSFRFDGGKWKHEVSHMMPSAYYVTLYIMFCCRAFMQQKKRREMNNKRCKLRQDAFTPSDYSFHGWRWENKFCI